MVLMNLFAGQQWKNRHGKTDIENRLMDIGERGGDSEMYGKSNTETYISMCKIDSHWELLYGSGNSNRRSVST